MRKIAVRLLALVVLVGVVAGGYYLVQQIPQEREDFPLAPVRRGDLVVKTHLRGELQAVRTLSLTAPNLGSATQITQLAPAGALASTSCDFSHEGLRDLEFLPRGRLSRREIRSGPARRSSRFPT